MRPRRAGQPGRGFARAGRRTGPEPVLEVVGLLGDFVCDRNRLTLEMTRPIEGETLQEQFDRARRAIEAGNGLRALRLLEPLLASKPGDQRPISARITPPRADAVPA